MNYEYFKLKNGLKVLLHEDVQTPLVAVNLMYRVGASNEDPNLTGIAHFLEHMMFTGTEKFPDFDAPLENAGGESNAYTSTDVTSYHAQIPAENLEIVLALEADRMANLSFDEEAYLTQKKVILEEFKESHLMRPYGDLWLKAREVFYPENHPYSWLPIGKSLEAIENISKEDLIAFYKKYYQAANASLAIAGNMPIEEMKALVIQYFDDVEAKAQADVVDFPSITAMERKDYQMEGNVADALITWNILMPAMFTKEYYIAEFCMHYLNSEELSPLYESIVEEKEWAADLSCYHFENIGPGTLTIELRGVEIDKMDEIKAELDQIVVESFAKGMNEGLMQSVLNKIEMALLFEELACEYKAHSLAYYSLLDREDMINGTIKHYQSIDLKEVLSWINDWLQTYHSSIFYYLPK